MKSSVGFTAIREGQERSVALQAGSRLLIGGATVPTRSLLEQAMIVEPIVIAGTMKRADTLKDEEIIITIVGSKRKRTHIVVPLGMMADIVRPLYESVVRGLHYGKCWEAFSTAWPARGHRETPHAGTYGPG
jgi:hypothetical protein